jgi:hypothetical protein
MISSARQRKGDFKKSVLPGDAFYKSGILLGIKDVFWTAGPGKSIILMVRFLTLTHG